MSFKDIGKYADKMKPFMGLTETSGEVFNDLKNLVREEGIDNANKLFKVGEIPKEVAEGVLNEAFSRSDLDAPFKAATKGTEAISNLDHALSGLKSSEGGVLGLGQAFKGLLTVIKPVAIGATAAFAAYKGFQFLDDKFTLTFGTAQKHAEESSSAYASTVSELTELNSTLDATKSRMTELQALKDAGTITVAQDAELSKLTRESELTSAQIASKQQTAEAQKRQAAEDARASIDFKSNYSLKSSDGTDSSGNPIPEKITRSEYVRELIANMEDAQTKIDEARSKLADSSISKKDRDKYTEQLESSLKNLEFNKNQALPILEELNQEAQGFYDAETDAVVAGFEKDAADNEALNRQFYSVGLTDLEKQSNALEAFFDGSSGKNRIKEQLLETANAGGDVVEELHKMGLYLEKDLGMTGSGKGDTFRKYFDDLAKASQEAGESVATVDGSYEGVEAAFASENSGARYDQMSNYYRQTKELYESGKVGTDDFLSFVKWAAPDSFKPNENTLDPQEYEDAWNSVSPKLERWYNAETPLQGVWNFVDDLQGQNPSLFKTLDKENKKIEFDTSQFSSTAQIAEELGVNAQVVDTMLHNMEDYGINTEGITFSGEGLKEYEDALQGLKTIRDGMDEGHGKERLDRLIDGENGFEAEYQGFQEDLSTLDEDQIVRIQFEYDLASIQQEIDDLDKRWAMGDHSAETGASRNIAQMAYRDKLAEQNQFNEENDEGYKEASETIADLQSKFYGAQSDDERMQTQDQLNSILKMQSVFQEAFSTDNTLDWNTFLNTEEAYGIFDEILASTTMTKEELEKLFDVDLDKEPQKRDSSETTDTEAIPDDAQNTTSTEDATSNMKITADTTEAEQAVNDIAEQDITVTCDANVEKALQKTNDMNPTETVTFNPDTKAVDAVTAETDGGNRETGFDANATEVTKEGKKTDGGNRITTYTANTTTLPTSLSPIFRYVKYVPINGISGGIGGIVRDTVSKAKAALGGKVQHTGTLLAPARANGTAYNVLNLRPAYTHGKVALPHAETALVNELGTESLIRDGVWSLIPGKMHIQSFKKGDIILNARQTADLLTHGKTNSHARAYAKGTLLSAYANAPGDPLPSLRITPAPNEANQTIHTSSDNSNSSDSNKDFKETIDYIEMAIDRIERKIKSLERTAGSVYNTFSKRNAALRDQIAAINEELSAQQNGYDRYMQEADSVSLSEDYKNQVRNGTIDIGKITDEKLAENIKDFQNWYEKALDCKDAMEELRETVKDLYREAFENIVTLYDNILGQIEHRQNLLEGYIDQTETQGYIVSTKYYEALIANEQEKLTQLTKQRQELIQAMNDAIANGNIEMYSEQWYEFQESVNDVNEAIQDADGKILDFKKSMQELEWEIFDKTQERISGITDESDFLNDLLSNDDMYDEQGKITESGTASLGLHGVNYNVHMSQADQYRKEMEAIQKELSKDPYNETLIERRKELLELQQKSILAAEKEKQAIKDLVEDGIQKQLDALDELIDKYLDALDSQDDVYQYQKKIDRQQEEVSKLEKQLLAYAGDDSEEGRLKRQQTEEDLAEAREDLEETQYEKSISEQKKLLDELYTEYESILNMRLDNIDQLITDVISNINSEAGNIRDTLISRADSVGYKLTDTMNTIWGTNGSIPNVLANYSNNFNSIMTSVQAAIRDIQSTIQRAIDASNKSAAGNINKIDRDQKHQTTPPPAPAPAPKKPANTDGGDGIPRIGDKVTFVSGKYYYDSYGSSPTGSQNLGGTVYITYMNTRPGATKPYGISRTPTPGEDDLGWVSLDQIKGYKAGIRRINKEQLAWTDEGRNGISAPEMIVRRSDGAVLTRLQSQDAVIPHDLTTNLFAWGAIHPDRFLAESYLTNALDHPNLPCRCSGSSIQNEINLNIGIEKVLDYNDFVTQLQKDKQFERVIQAMTLDQIAGKNSLRKYVQLY